MAQLEEQVTDLKTALEQFERPLVTYARRITGDLARAQDVVQDVFERLWRADPPIGSARLRAWLFTACRNRALDVRRKERRMTLVDEHTPEPMVAADAVHAVERKEQRRLVADAFGRLTPAQAEMLRLRVVDELSYKEVAEVTGSTVANVGYQLHAAVRKLREEVSK